MGFIGGYVDGPLLVRGGSVQIGADTNLYRGAANRLHTDDAIQIGGTANLTGATRIGGALTANAGIDSSGTVTVTGRLVAPHGTASPTVATDGQFVVYTKADVSYIGFRINGTPNYIAFPTTTHGTITVTVGGTP